MWTYKVSFTKTEESSGSLKKAGDCFLSHSPSLPSSLGLSCPGLTDILTMLPSEKYILDCHLTHTHPWSKNFLSFPKEDFLFLNNSTFCLLIYFWLLHVACVILVPGSGIESGPPAVKVQIPNHWTASEFPKIVFSNIVSETLWVLIFYSILFFNCYLYRLKSFSSHKLVTTYSLKNNTLFKNVFLSSSLGFQKVWKIIHFCIENNINYFQSRECFKF